MHLLKALCASRQGLRFVERMALEIFLLKMRVASLSGEQGQLQSSM